MEVSSNKNNLFSGQETSLAISLGVCFFNNGFEETLTSICDRCDLSYTTESVAQWRAIDARRVNDGDCTETLITEKKLEKLNAVHLVRNRTVSNTMKESNTNQDNFTENQCPEVEVEDADVESEGDQSKGCNYTPKLTIYCYFVAIFILYSWY